jgi:hypothetical protein
MFKALARYILRNELAILNKNLQIAQDRFFKLNDEFERFCFDAEAYKERYHELLWKRSDEELQQIEEIKKERAKLALWNSTSEFDEF